MRYYKVEFSNGFCGCDEEFVYQQEEDEARVEEYFLDFVNYYTYAEGAAGINIGTEEEVEAGEAELTDEEYMQNILDYSYIEEITKEEYDELVADGWEER